MGERKGIILNLESAYVIEIAPINMWLFFLLKDIFPLLLSELL